MHPTSLNHHHPNSPMATKPRNTFATASMHTQDTNTTNVSLAVKTKEPQLPQGTMHPRVLLMPRHQWRLPAGAEPPHSHLRHDPSCCQQSLLAYKRHYQGVGAGPSWGNGAGTAGPHLAKELPPAPASQPPTQGYSFGSFCVVWFLV